MKPFIVFLMAAGILSACNQGPKPENTGHTETTETTSEHQSSGLALNNGAKWKVNPEMLPHITQSRQIFSDYLSRSGTDHKALAAELSLHTDSLIASCTMQGADHDALHQWLHPHMELIEALSKAGSEAEVKSSMDKLQASFEQFERFFE